MFPGYQRGTWSYDKVAKLWYHHRFYDFQPDLNWNNPEVREEIGRVVAFWLELGVSGFRMDGAPFVIEEVHPDSSDRIMHYEWLNDLRDHIGWRRGDAAVLAEANVPREQMLEFFGAARRPAADDVQLRREPAGLPRAGPGDRGAGADGDRGLARRSRPRAAGPRSCATTTRSTCPGCGTSERADVFAKFGPDKDMQLYDRGIRRRLATMLGGDQRRIRLAYVLQFSLPGTPVIRYGEEIGMGEDLSLQQRDSIRTPMQWADAPQAGFSTADRDRPAGDRQGRVRLSRGQRPRPAAGPGLAAALVPERAAGRCGSAPSSAPAPCTVLDTRDERVLAPALRLPDRVRARRAQPVDREGHGRPGPAAQAVTDGFPVDVLADRAYPDAGDLTEVQLDGSGYRWLRLARTVGA